eukprot:553187-Pyramimonas_sp.AAC.1
MIDSDVPHPPGEFPIELWSAVRNGNHRTPITSDPGPHAGFPGPKGGPIAQIDHLEVGHATDDVQERAPLAVERQIGS